MSPAAHTLRVAGRVLRAEGWRSFRDRALDRLAEAERRRSFSPAPSGWRPGAPIPVLNLSATPPAPRLGGVQAQLLARIEAEAGSRSLALLYPEAPAGGSWRLEVQEGGRRRSVRIPGGAPGPLSIEDGDFERAVREAAERVGAKAVHVEGLAGLPLGSLLRLGREGLRLVLTLHDFAAFCPRPHLLERPFLRFCEYSRDLGRCGRCLREDWPVEDAFQGARRELSAGLLAGADALVFPSEFLRRRHQELFPGLSGDRQRVIAPAGPDLSALPPPDRAGEGFHVALAGGVQAHKGALVFEEVVRRMSGEDQRWSAYGGGDADLLLRLRRLGVHVRGYYRSGSLPRLLRRDRVDLALLLSIVPESYGLVLGECLVAGVPVVAFDLGALGERVPRLGAGRLVPPEAGAEGVALAIRSFVRENPLSIRPETTASIPDARMAAAAHLELYRELGLS